MRLQTCYLLLLQLIQSIRALTTSSASTAITTPWLIVGGGIHGVHIATRLLGEGVARDLIIVDDAPALLFKWKARTEASGMEYLRSPAGFHLDLKEDSLRRFGPKGLFSKDYERPQLDLFNQHCDAVIEEYQLNPKHIRGRVTSVKPHEDHVEVEVSTTTKKEDTSVRYRADRIVLALGNDRPCYPDWVTPELLETGRVRHLLDTDLEVVVDDPSTGASVAIVGGGITAAHKALQLTKQRHNNNNSSPVVHLISRHAPKEQQFDTHQDWMMDAAAAERSLQSGGSGIPKRQLRFRATTSFSERRRIIQRERTPGTVTAAVHRGRQGLQYAIQNRRVQWHPAEVVGVEISVDGLFEIQLSCGATLEVDQVLLATGFGTHPPWINAAQKLPVSDFCGYPIVDSNLRWGHDRLFVTGALAELELGPSARNIAGARLAAERILQACGCIAQ